MARTTLVVNSSAEIFPPIEKWCKWILIGVFSLIAVTIIKNYGYSDTPRPHLNPEDMISCRLQ